MVVRRRHVLGSEHRLIAAERITAAERVTASERIADTRAIPDQRSAGAEADEPHRSSVIGSCRRPRAITGSKQPSIADSFTDAKRLSF